MPPATLEILITRRNTHGSGLNTPTTVNLPTPLLAAVIGGVFLVLSALSALLFFCSWRKKVRRHSCLSVLSRQTKPGSLHVSSELEKQVSVEEVRERARLRKQIASVTISPTPVFDFSPPSPHWQPAIPRNASTERQRRHHSSRGGTVTDNTTRSPGQHLSPTSPRFRRPSHHRHQDSHIVSHTRLHSKQQRLVVPGSISGKQPLNIVPRIEVHPVQDSHIAKSSSPGNSKQNKTHDRHLAKHQNTGNRPLSGLGITTIDFSTRSYSKSQRSPPLTSNSRLISQEPLSIHRSHLTPQSGPQASALDTRGTTASSLEDVRLAYTLSASSIGSASNSVHAVPKQEASAQKADENRHVFYSRSPNVSLGSTQQRNDNTKRETVKGGKSVSESLSTCTASQTRKELRSRSDTTKNTISLSVRRQAGSPVKSSSKRNALSKRLALGVDAIDDSTKSELYALRSLGSASFDSLIAYLEDTVEPDDAPKKRHRKSRAEAPKQNPTQTREDTMQLDEGSFRDWVGKLNTSASILQLTGIQLENRVPENQDLPRPGCVSHHTAEDAIPRDFSRNEETRREERGGSQRESLKESARQGQADTLLSEPKFKRRTRGGSSRHNDAFLSAAPSTVASLIDQRESTQPWPLAKPSLCETKKERGEFLSALPSFSIPSSATKLFTSLPSSDNTLSTPGEAQFVSQKFSKKGEDTREVPSLRHTILSRRGRSTTNLELTPEMLPRSSSFRRLSSDSSSSSSSVGSLTQRHDWGRESLTPRFNHLRTVLEGNREAIPPMPNREMKGTNPTLTTLGPSSFSESPGAPGQPGFTPLLLHDFRSASSA